MKTIPLNHGQVAIIDDEDFDDISQFKWYALYQSKVNGYYAVRKIPKHQQGLLGFTEQMHRRILGLKLKDGWHTDHINHDTLDNRRSNIRIVTVQENQWNRKNQSLFGTCVWRQKKRFRAMIWLSGKRQDLGLFSTPEEAQIAVKGAKMAHRATPGSDL